MLDLTKEGDYLMSIVQESFPTPNMVGQAWPSPGSYVGNSVHQEGHQPAHAGLDGDAVSWPRTSTRPNSIPRLLSLGEGMRLVRQIIQPVPQHPVQAFHMDRVGAPDGLLQPLAPLDPHHPTSPTLLDRLRQTDPEGRHQARSARLAKVLRVSLRTI